MKWLRRPDVMQRIQQRIPPTRRELARRMDEQEYALRKLRRHVSRWDSALASQAARPSPEASAATAIRSFDLAVPSYDGASDRSLRVELPNELYVPKFLHQNGLAGYEARTLACWIAMVAMDREGAAFDVGANVGPFAWIAAVISDRRVVSFEPVPELLAAVTAVADRNELRIETEQIALSDQDGTANFFLSDQTDSSNSLIEGFRPSSRTIAVAVEMLDSYVDRTGVVPHALKIDTETNEAEVIRGAVNTLRRHRPWMIVEVLADRTEDRLMEALEGLGYSWYRIDDSSPLDVATEIVGDPEYVHTNWLLAPEIPADDFWLSLDRWHAALQRCVPGR